MRNAIKASVLMLALCCPVSAGIVLCPPVAPPSQPATVAQEPTTDGIIQNGASDGIMDNGVAITFAEVVLNLLALS
jgi:hypothetical protein